ncbi:MAG TPA: BTAD domain-containing putative transcriptional regulator [Streptosporangiaceae bacterium]|nr:BTAD domain-containing putative transcriptional regulator [Streptosporangiaceae bacterium]
MEFRILGHLEAVAGGRPLPLGGPTEQRLLAVLLLDAGHVVPLSRLVDALWEEAPPARADKLARNAISRLRRMLADSGDPDPIETCGAGYRLAIGCEALDARRFESKVAQAQLAASAGQVAQAACLLRSALDLWHGQFLAGMGGRVIEAAATAWNERYCAAAEAYYDHQLALGRHREVIGELSALTAGYPLREKPVAQLMLALYRCGRQADALAIYSDTRALLAEEMGLDPGPELQLVQQRILEADPALHAPPEVSSGCHSSLGLASLPVPRQLPGLVRHFVGRSAELQELSGVLERAATPGNAVVISAVGGMPGVGKTVLAVHWARLVADRFPDGQLYVDLRGYDETVAPLAPAEAVRGFLDALGVPVERIPAGLDTQTALYRSLVAGRRILILLDNARDEQQVRPLLPGGSGCLVVVTSRNQLAGLAVREGAHLVALDVLTPGDAYELLASRLGSGRVAAEPQAAVGLVALCGRLPLALSVAAARVVTQPGLSLSAVVGELAGANNRLDALEVSDTSARVRAVFSWSYLALKPEAARMFRLLGIHVGPDISAAAAASLAGMPLPRAREALAGLTHRHLIMEHVPGRFAFHDLLRVYAAEQAHHLDSVAERRSVTHRVLDHYLHTGHAAAVLLFPRHEPIHLGPRQPGVLPEDLPDQQQALRWFTAEYRVMLAVVAAAANGGYDRHAWQIAWTLAHFLDRQGHWHDLEEILRTAQAAAQRNGNAAARAIIHRETGRVYIQLGRLGDARVQLHHALHLFGQLDDQPGQARIYHGLGVVAEAMGSFAEALAHSEQAAELFRATGDKRAYALAVGATGWQLALLGDYHQAIARCQQAMDSLREVGDITGESQVLDSLGYARQHLGDYPAAIVCYQRSLALAEEAGLRWGQAEALSHLGDAQLANGDPGAARGAWHRSLAIFTELGHRDAETVRVKLDQLTAIASTASPNRRRSTGV